MKSVIIFGSAEWDFLYQRPRAIAEELSKLGYTVYFFEPLRPIAKEVASFFDRNKKARTLIKNDNLKIIKWYCPTAFRGTISPKADKLFFSWKFEAFLKKNRITNATIMIALSFWYDGLIDRKYANNNSFKIIYDCIDELSVFARNEKILKKLVAREKKLISDAQLIVCTATILIEHIKKVKPEANIKYIPNGVGLKHFLEEKTSSEKIAGIKKPIVGFIGGIYSWVDIKLIEHAAAKLPHISFVLVGPSQHVNLSGLKSLPNVSLFGPIDYQEVPSYVNAFDVCMIPFILNDIIQSTDPIKIYEYLALQKPIVVTDFPEARKYSDILYVAKSKEDFVVCIQSALNERLDEERNKLRYQVAYNASWEKRAKAVAEIL